MPRSPRAARLAPALLLAPSLALALPGVVPTWTTTGDQDLENLGFEVSAVGDLNGDGYADMAAGAPLHDGVDQDSGRAFVWLGSPSGLPAAPSWTGAGAVEDARFGEALAAADVNGDGYDDLLVGAPEHDVGGGPVGGAFCYLGSASGVATTPAWTALGESTNDRFGRSVAGVGDVNGDGYDDVLVGAWRYTDVQVRQGRAYLYLGSASGLSTTPDWTSSGVESGENHGWTVAAAGDVNDDGYDDVLVAAPGYSNLQANEGRVHLWHGSASGLASAPDWSIEADWESASLGFSLAGVGDVNGDDYDDVVLGAAPEGVFDLGGDRVALFLGSASGLAPSATWSALEEPWPHSQIAVRPAGDVNGDGLADVIVGREVLYLDHKGDAWVFLGDATGGLEASAAWHWTPAKDEMQFGSAVAGADVDGDGLSDLFIGARGYNGDGLNRGRVGLYPGDGSEGDDDDATGDDDDDTTGDDDDSGDDDDDATGDDDDTASDDDDSTSGTLGDDDDSDPFADSTGCGACGGGSQAWLLLLLPTLGLRRRL